MPASPITETRNHSNELYVRPNQETVVNGSLIRRWHGTHKTSESIDELRRRYHMIVTAGFALMIAMVVLIFSAAYFAVNVDSSLHPYSSHSLIAAFLTMFACGAIAYWSAASSAFMLLRSLDENVRLARKEFPGLYPNDSTDREWLENMETVAFARSIDRRMMRLYVHEDVDSVFSATDSPHDQQVMLEASKLFEIAKHFGFELCSQAEYLSVARRKVHTRMSAFITDV